MVIFCNVTNLGNGGAMGVLGVGGLVLAVSMKNLNIFKANMNTNRDTVKHCRYNSGVITILF